MGIDFSPTDEAADSRARCRWRTAAPMDIVASSLFGDLGGELRSFRPRLDPVEMIDLRVGFCAFWEPSLSVAVCIDDGDSLSLSWCWLFRVVFLASTLCPPRGDFGGDLRSCLPRFDLVDVLESTVLYDDVLPDTVVSGSIEKDASESVSSGGGAGFRFCTIFFALICFFLPFSKMSSFSDTCDLLVRVVALVLAEMQDAVSSSSLSSVAT